MRDRPLTVENVLLRDAGAIFAETATEERDRDILTRAAAPGARSSHQITHILLHQRQPKNLHQRPTISSYVQLYRQVVSARVSKTSFRYSSGPQLKLGFLPLYRHLPVRNYLQSTIRHFTIVTTHLCKRTLGDCQLIKTCRSD